jgi:hypothetical protein
VFTPGAAQVLPLDPGGVLALPLLPGLVQRRHPQRLVTQLFGHIPADHALGLIVVPHRVVEQPLHPIRRGVTGMLGQGPPVLARQVSLISPTMYLLACSNGCTRAKHDRNRPCTLDRQPPQLSPRHVKVRHRPTVEEFPHLVCHRE